MNLPDYKSILVLAILGLSVYIIFASCLIKTGSEIIEHADAYYEEVIREYQSINK